MIKSIPQNQTVIYAYMLCSLHHTEVDGKSSCSEGRGHGSSKVRSINPDMINGAEKNEKLRLCNIS